MDNQRPLLYLSLFFVLFLLYSAWQEDYGPQPVADISEAEKASYASPAGAEHTQAGMEQDDVPDSPMSSVPTEVPNVVSAQSATVDASRLIRIRTDVLDLDITTRGGTVTRTDLPTYPVDLDEPEFPVRIFDAIDRAYVAQSGLVHAKVGGVSQSHRAPNHHAIYHAEQAEYYLEDGKDELVVPLVWQSEDGLEVVKTFRFKRGEFLIEVDHEVRNNSNDVWQGRQYRQLRHGPTSDQDGSSLIYTYTGSAFYDVDHYAKRSFEDMGDDPLQKNMTGSWVAVLQHYFLSAWVPGGEETNYFYTKVIDSGMAPEYLIGLRSAEQIAIPGESTQFTTRLYVGPKTQEDLAEIATGLDLTVDYGIFAIFAKPLFWLTKQIHDLIGNWGWAIILVTFLIKLVFYKLSETSYRSMARMRKFTPKIQELKDRYGDDKQKLGQAQMELFKKEKINPLGGCLPILIQIPVFIAFYWMLLESVEMRQTPFILWIDDLSSMDPYFVLPVLMGVTMFIQQKLNPAPIDPMQAKVMMLMPFIFTVFFAFFPSGLVLYWFANNLLSIAQQWYITRKIEQES